MLALFTYFFLAFAEGGGGAAGESSGFWYEYIDPYVNYPGFEAWRFFNLGLFIWILYYLLRKPLSSAFTAKREAIRADLIKAEEAKKAAQAKLELAEEKLSGVEAEKVQLIKKAEEEAKSERQRIEQETENDIRRVESQAATEISRRTAQVNLELKRYSAKESIRLAEEKIKKTISAAKDAELVKSNIDSIGGIS